LGLKGTIQSLPLSCVFCFTNKPTLEGDKKLLPLRASCQQKWVLFTEGVWKPWIWPLTLSISKKILQAYTFYFENRFLINFLMMRYVGRWDWFLFWKRKGHLPFPPTPIPSSHTRGKQATCVFWDITLLIEGRPLQGPWTNV
jgi:hypothetical protein